MYDGGRRWLRSKRYNLLADENSHNERDITTRSTKPDELKGNVKGG
jgi:hypothetical protein